MKTIVIADVHNKIDQVETIIEAEGRDEKYAFLGDWFDDFNDSEEDARRTAAYLDNLASSLNDNDFYLGNHDAWYLWPTVPGLRCSGNEYYKRREIQYNLHCGSYWDRVKLFGVEQGWLLSHAGFNPDLYRFWIEDNAGASPELRQKDAKISCTDVLKLGRVPDLLAAGRARGGPVPRGGVTWLDWNREFLPIRGVNQIVGHSRGARPRLNEKTTEYGEVLSSNWCLDCDMKYYGILEDGEFTFKETPCK